jgi:hypothetical protein
MATMAAKQWRKQWRQWRQTMAFATTRSGIPAGQSVARH